MKIQYRMTLWIFAILLVVGVVGASAVLFFQRRAAVDQFEQSALTLAKALQHSLEHYMLDGRRERVQDTVARIASGRSINEVTIIASSQEVFASGEVAEIGVVRSDEAITRALSTGETVTRNKKQYGQNEISVILPVANRAECHTCHGSEATILGVIEVGLDRSPLDAQIRDQTLIMTFIGGIAFVCVGGALGLMLRSTVVGPLAVLAASARRIAGGDYGARARIEEKDEVGLVAHTFNEMAERVEQHARALEASKAELEDRVQERTREVRQMAVVRGELLERLVSAQEEERRRVARELHDEASQNLTAITMDLAMAMASLPDDAVEARRTLAESRALVRQTLAELRDLIRDLRPEVLEQLGLESALRSYVRRHVDDERIQTEISFAGVVGLLPPQVEITLFRVIQEAITNIVRHSGASLVKIRVASGDSEVTATVEDNGKGFDVAAAFQSSESWGLRGIRERVAVVGGELSIESGPGKGTRLQFKVPIGRPESG